MPPKNDESKVLNKKRIKRLLKWINDGIEDNKLAEYDQEIIELVSESSNMLRYINELEKAVQEAYQIIAVLANHGTITLSSESLSKAKNLRFIREFNIVTGETMICLEETTNAPTD